MRPSPRDRLLDAADELFYEEGIRSVGIDRVIERAGVAKASLYSTFGSKDELVRAYLTRRLESRQARLREAVEAQITPRDKIMAVYEYLARTSARPGYRGCAFINPSAEATPGSAAAEVTDLSREYLHGLFRELAKQAGAANPETLAQGLMLLYDGAVIGTRLDHDPAVAQAARAAAATLLDAALA